MMNFTTVSEFLRRALVLFLVALPFQLYADQSNDTASQHEAYIPLLLIPTPDLTSEIDELGRSTAQRTAQVTDMLLTEEIRKAIDALQGPAPTVQH